MIERLKEWVSKALGLPTILREVTAASRRVDLLAQRADTLSVQLTHWETQAAAWQAVLVNEQLKIRAALEEMDILLRGIALLPAERRAAADGIGGRDSEAIAALSEQVEKLRADLLEQNRATSDERSQ